MGAIPCPFASDSDFCVGFDVRLTNNRKATKKPNQRQTNISSVVFFTETKPWSLFATPIAPLYTPQYTTLCTGLVRYTCKNQQKR